MYNLLKSSDNYSDTSESLRQLKREKQNMTNAGNPDNVTIDGSSSFKYKSSFLGNLVAVAGANRVLENAKIVVSLKYT